MKYRRMKFLVIGISFVNSMALGSVTPSGARHHIKAAIIMTDEKDVILSVNPFSQSSYKIIVENPAEVVKQLKQKKYIGQAELDITVRPKDDSFGTGMVHAIAIIPSRTLPIYDGDFVEVPQGKAE